MNGINSIILWLIFFLIGAMLNRKYWNNEFTLYRKPKYIYTKRHYERWIPNYWIAFVTSIAFAFIMWSITFLFL